jgi:formylglycine-generating enzyme required for sulfatase activity
MSPVLDPEFTRLGAALRGRYTLVRQLGHGGMGTVYLARDDKLGREVAIKVLLPATRAALGTDRFEREVQLVSRLSHPHIVPLFEADEVDGIPFFVMEYVAGETVQNRLERDGPMALDEALRITTEVGDALQYAHEHGTIHRDVKPANILLAGGHALLADFGIAKSVDPAVLSETLTTRGAALGTIPYMSPEQACGERRIDARSDVYSLAAVLYEMLVGEPPFTGPNTQAIISRICSEPPRSIRTVRFTIPAHIDSAVASGLAKIAADRPPTARAFVERLSRPEATTVVDSRRRRRMIAAGVGAVVLAIAIVVGLMWGGPKRARAGMALVAGGTFHLFGGDCSRCLSARDVQLDSFYIDRTEVPVVAYARFVASGKAPAPWTVRPPDSLPATGVLWAEAAAFCRWRSPTARLPTEEEWEAAARGHQGRLYPWGSTWESGRANADNWGSGLAPVGAFTTGSSPVGALNLIGNAWEWTASVVGSGYVIRGGAYNSPGTVATSVYRTSLPAAAPESLRQSNYGNTGFRCVRSVR